MGLTELTDYTEKTKAMNTPTINDTKYKAILFNNVLLCIIVAAIAFCLKLHYSRATSDDLVWILKPTAGLVEYVTNTHFVRAENAGFLSREYRILIAPACAGVNFLIMAFCMSAFSSMHQPGLRRKKLIRLAVCGISSYLLTIVVNTIRITAAIYLYKYCISWGWLTPERIHRIEGIVIYFVFLFIFYLGVQKVMSAHNVTDKKKNLNKNKIKTILPSAGRAPLFWYLSITLGVPLLNTAYLKNFSRFTEHFIMVISVSIMLLFIVTYIKRYILNRIDGLVKSPNVTVS